MARRPAPPDPDLAALARARLARLLGEDTSGARRASRPAAVRAAVRAVERDVERDVDDDVGPVGLDDLEPERRFTRWHLGVVAAVLVVGLAWGAWSWVRTRPEAVAAPSVVQTANVLQTSAPASGAAATAVPTAVATRAGAGAGTGTGTPGAAPSAAGLVVHVLGAVRHPGLVRLPVGARVEDAIEAAGGLRSGADPDELNLAQPLEDGVQVVVGTRAHPAGEVRSAGQSSGSGSGGTSGTSSAGGSASGTVDLNAATVDQLDTLPGVGPVTAQKILDWRQQHGRFSRADELQEVDGIGPKTYARIAPHVRV